MIQKIKCFFGKHEYSLEWFERNYRVTIIKIRCHACKKELKTFEIEKEYFISTDDCRTGRLL